VRYVSLLLGITKRFLTKICMATEAVTMIWLLVVYVTALLGAGPLCAQTPAPLKPVRMLIANGKLASVVDTPLYFKLLQVNLGAGQATTYFGSNAMIYPTSGSLTVESEGETKTLQDGDGAFVGAWKNATFKAAGGRAATFFEFLLVPAADLNKAPNAKPAVMTELFQTVEPIKGLKPGPYEFTLSKVIAPPKAPAPPMHHRSGAALYYLLSGSGLLKMADKAEPRGRGVIQYEPQDFIHSWQNAGDAPLILLQANISAEGTPEIIFLQ
jgi:quercetin dioxygenase-like cupin family protein